MFSATKDIDDQDPNNYQYDAIGNLIRDVKEGITLIQWNINGKVRSVVKPAPAPSTATITINFFYDPMGNRWKKEVRETYPGLSAISNKYTSTYYVRDAQGNVLSTYKRVQTPSNATNPDNFYWEEAHIYGSSRVGVEKVNVHLVKKAAYFLQPIYATPQAKNTKIRGQKRYELSNHLGNVLTVIADHRIVNKTGTTVSYYEAVIISAQDYYPFGSVMPKRSTQLYVNSSGATSYRNEYDNNTNWTAVDLYRYGFNGKEEDTEWNSGVELDYGFRIYDPRVARFLSVDPMAYSFPWYTPYQYASNSPIYLIDLDGLEGTWYKPWTWTEADVKTGLATAGEIIYRTPQGVIHGATVVATGLPNAFIKGVTNDPSYNGLRSGFSYEQGFYKDDRSASSAAYQMDLFSGTVSTTSLVAGGEIQTATNLVKKGGTAVFKALKPCGCFTSGTLVFTRKGYIPIENILVGDSVWAFNDTTGIYSWKPVISTFTIKYNEIYRIYFGDQIIEATSEHPFFINGSWLNVDELCENDSLTLNAGRKIAIDSIIVREDEVDVFNFIVEDYHTYYVTTTQILVHNGSPCTIDADGFLHTLNGLKLGVGSQHGNRWLHIAEHTYNDLGKKLHGVFYSNKGDVVMGLLDKGYKQVKDIKWSKTLAAGQSETINGITRTVQSNGNEFFVVPMGKAIGYQGGNQGTGAVLSNLKLVMKKGTAEVITAHPF